MSVFDHADDGGDRVRAFLADLQLLAREDSGCENIFWPAPG